MAAAEDIVVKLRAEQDGSFTTVVINVGKAVGDLGEKANKTSSELGKMSASFAAGQLAADAFRSALDTLSRATVEQFKAAVDVADQISKLSQQAGIAARDLAAYRYAADLAGVSLENFAVGVRYLNTAIATNNEALRAVGVSTRDANTAILELADVFAALPDGVEKTRLSMELFGRSGTSMIPMLNGGSAALAEMTDEAQRLGLVMDEYLYPASEQLNDTWTKIGYTWEGTINILMGRFLPSLQEMSNVIFNLAKGNISLLDSIGLLGEAFAGAVFTPPPIQADPMGPPAPRGQGTTQGRDLQRRLASVFARSDSSARGGTGASSVARESDPYAAALADEKALQQAMEIRYQTSRKAAQQELEQLQASGAAVEQLIGAQERLNAIERERLQRQIQAVEGRMGPFLPGQSELNAAEVAKLRQEIELLPDATKKWQRATEGVRSEIDQIGGAISGTIRSAVQSLISGGGGFSLGDIAKSAGQLIAANLADSFLETLLGKQGFIQQAIGSIFGGGGGGIMQWLTGSGGGSSSLVPTSGGGALAGLGTLAGKAFAVGVPALIAGGLYQTITRGDPTLLQAGSGLMAGGMLLPSSMSWAQAPGKALGGLLGVSGAAAAAGLGVGSTLLGAGLGIGRALDRSQGSVLSYNPVIGGIGGLSGAASGALAGSFLGPIGTIVGGVLGGLVGLISGLFSKPSFEEKWGEYLEREFDRVGLNRARWNWGIRAPAGLQRDALAYRENTPGNQALMGLFGQAELLGKLLYGVGRRATGFANLFVGNEMDFGNTTARAQENLSYYATRSGLDLVGALEGINQRSLDGTLMRQIMRDRKTPQWNPKFQGYYNTIGAYSEKARQDAANAFAAAETEQQILDVLGSPLFASEIPLGVNAQAIGRGYIRSGADSKTTIDIDGFLDEMNKAASVAQNLGTALRTGMSEFIVALSQGATDATERLAATFLGGVRDVLLGRVSDILYEAIGKNPAFTALVDAVRLGPGGTYDPAAIMGNATLVLGQAMSMSQRMGDIMSPLMGAFSFESLRGQRDAVMDRQFGYRLQDASPRRRRSLLRGRVGDVESRLSGLLGDEIDDSMQVSQLAALYNEMGSYADAFNELGDRRTRDSLLSRQAAGLDQLAQIQEKRAEEAKALWERIAAATEAMAKWLATGVTPGVVNQNMPAFLLLNNLDPESLRNSGMSQWLIDWLVSPEGQAAVQNAVRR